MDRPYDIVLHGASGFVGRLVAAQLAAHAGTTRVALSGRSAQRLAAVRDAIGVGWPLIRTDATDPDSVAALAASTAVVATTVGPYSRYGLPLVRACADAGTSYCDLTGETSFVRASADAAHERARASGARIVHSAGFDSVPPDLAVLLLHEQARADGTGTLGETAMLLVSARGGLSGGTIDSMRSELASAAEQPEVLADPYGLSPDRRADPPGDDENDPLLPFRDPLSGRWVAPHPFGPHDRRIVRRSNALLGHPYGPGFRYREGIAVPAGPIGAGVVTAALAGFAAGMRFGPTRAVLDRLLPSPGAGPSERTRRTGHFRIEVRTVTSTGARYQATVAASGDPGYAATSVIFAESALCLACDRLDSPGGVLTPAAGLGRHLVDRLRSRGVELSVTRLS